MAAGSSRSNGAVLDGTEKVRSRSRCSRRSDSRLRRTRQQAVERGPGGQDAEEDAAARSRDATCRSSRPSTHTRPASARPRRPTRMGRMRFRLKSLDHDLGVRVGRGIAGEAVAVVPAHGVAAADEGRFVPGILAPDLLPAHAAGQREAGGHLPVAGERAGGARRRSPRRPSPWDRCGRRARASGPVSLRFEPGARPAAPMPSQQAAAGVHLEAQPRARPARSPRSRRAAACPISVSAAALFCAILHLGAHGDPERAPRVLVGDERRERVEDLLVGLVELVARCPRSRSRTRRSCSSWRRRRRAPRRW